MQGLLAVDAASASLTPDVQTILELLADQVAIAIDDSRLLEENLRLERELAQRERLAALGRMAATVAHEIKNPLSAIKSIAQVMREDESLRNEYERDLGLIVGETDRLSQSVTQLLSFARKESPAGQPLSVDELVRSVVDLFRASAKEQGIVLDLQVKVEAELAGRSVSALRDALSNLLLNALQATPHGGRVELIAAASDGELVISVQDSGSGVPVDLRERIWEPFFTTRQRGTGLGLAIVRKRVQEVGGTAVLVSGKWWWGVVSVARRDLETSLETGFTGCLNGTLHPGARVIGTLLEGDQSAMKINNFLAAMLLVLCAAVCLSVEAQATQDPTGDVNLDTQLYLIVGTNQDVDDTKLPAALDPVVKQLRSALPFKNYRLAATLINRVKNEGRLDLSWIGGPMAAQTGAASNVTPSFSQFKVRQVRLSRNADNQPMVQMLGFNFGARIPIQTPGAIAASGAVAPSIAYENTGVSTDISMRESEPVIVGTLNIGPSGDAIILVVSAKRTQK